MREFFGITEKFRFEIADLTTVVTILNVALILAGYWWAPVLGIANCIVCLALNVKNHAHINMYVTQVALIVLNVYFLTL